MPFGEVNNELFPRSEQQVPSSEGKEKIMNCSFLHSSLVIVIALRSGVKILEPESLGSNPGSAAS